ncbi:hypothetical protein FB567DRAFT_135069 [Paraphoma chrysanthemicola]|uniref:BTB domain-containing protein n=1 Tax=Paraphoma chrysanthemicola TaxID=798071 RepID=A0A8K0QYS2_9PLEO|nr:hypothetical protein FB567DRAFT_135069 [Paraphoma chrysanthemicola]
MAAQDFIHDLSKYLFAGNLSDLTLNFGEKSWQIHKAIACCHSVWFQKAVNIGFEESNSGVITLHDDPEFADAIDCMVSYFYKASYDVSQYEISESLLHAQVAIMADKYDCASLYKLARTSFAKAINAVESNDWVAVAALVYDNTTTDLPAHVELRSLVVAAVANRPVVLKGILQLGNTAELLRSHADLATDLLLSGPYMSKKADVRKWIVTCSRCQYVHVGSRKCSRITARDGINYDRTCPKCASGTGVTSKRNSYKYELVDSIPCPECDGIHTSEPVSMPQFWADFAEN